jgi:phytoene dehydrogenase-like protein
MDYRGHQLQMGSHLLEDPGDSLTRVFDSLGLHLEHSQRSDSMPFWERDRWVPVQDFYRGGARQGIKRCIDALMESDYGDFDAWDHASLREWMSLHTTDAGAFKLWEAISMLEQITTNWWEHSASENLYARKLAYTMRRTAGYSFWPMGGWESVYDRMAAAFTELGGSLLQPVKVRRVLVEQGRVVGVELAAMAGSTDAGREVLEADRVVVTAPVWNLLQLFDDGVLPWDLVQRIRLLSANRNRACWIGYWIAAKEPVIASTERELGAWFAGPRTGLAGFHLNFTGYDPSVSPPGEYLTCAGAVFDAEHFGDRAWLSTKFAQFWLDLEEMLPAARRAVWKKPHLVTAFGVICKPGLVGGVRPDTTVRGIDGLWLAGDTTRARGIGVDKAARSGISAAELVLGSRIPFFSETVRY